MTVHPIPPVYDTRSRVLILGSFPSVRSRADGFYYAHPQNRFWRVLAALFSEEVPADIPARRAFLLRHRIALHDVLAACEICGSADSAIREAVPSDLGQIFATAPIRHVFLNGQTAGAYYRRYFSADIAVPYTVLPSTSPANAACSLETLVAAWQGIVGEGGSV